MTLQEFLSRLDVKSGHGDQYMAKCPAHDDKTASLSVGSGEKGFVIKCHAGCNTVDVLAAMGLTEQDLFYEPKRVKERTHLVATYQYINHAIQTISHDKRQGTWHTGNNAAFYGAEFGEMCAR